MADPQPLEPLIQVDIVKVTPDDRRAELDVVATEVPQHHHGWRDRSRDPDVHAGTFGRFGPRFLCTSGLLSRPEDFLGCEVDPAQWAGCVWARPLIRAIEPAGLHFRMW